MRENLLAKKLVQLAAKRDLAFFASEVLGYEVTDYQKEWYRLAQNPRIR